MNLFNGIFADAVESGSAVDPKLLIKSRMQILDKDELEERANAVVASMQTYLDAGKKVFLMSSFQAQSLPLQHMVSHVDRPIPVYYTKTGFLFSETIRFAEDLAEKLNLKVIALQPMLPLETTMAQDITKFRALFTF